MSWRAFFYTFSPPERERASIIRQRTGFVASCVRLRDVANSERLPVPGAQQRRRMHALLSICSLGSWVCGDYWWYEWSSMESISTTIVIAVDGDGVSIFILALAMN